MICRLEDGRGSTHSLVVETITNWSVYRAYGHRAATRVWFGDRPTPLELSGDFESALTKAVEAYLASRRATP